MPAQAKAGRNSGDRDIVKPTCLRPNSLQSVRSEIPDQTSPYKDIVSEMWGQYPASRISKDMTIQPVRKTINGIIWKMPFLNAGSQQGKVIQEDLGLKRRGQISKVSANAVSGKSIQTVSVKRASVLPEYLLSLPFFENMQ